MAGPSPSLEEIEAVFMALSHEARRHILLILSHKGGELPSGYLASLFGHSWPTTTRHLGVLEKAGLVEVRREGRSSHYRLKRERLTRVLSDWLENLEPPNTGSEMGLDGPKTHPESPRGQIERKAIMTSAASKVPKIFRVTLEVGDLEKAASFYAKLLGMEGKRHPGSRHYFDCGGVILAVLDPTAGGMTPTPGPKSLYFALPDLDAVHKRAKSLDALAPYKVHGEAAGAVTKRPWGERSFYVVDPWGNDLCFVEDGTLYT